MLSKGTTPQHLSLTIRQGYGACFTVAPGQSPPSIQMAQVAAQLKPQCLESGSDFVKAVWFNGSDRGNQTLLLVRLLVQPFWLKEGL